MTQMTQLSSYCVSKILNASNSLHMSLVILFNISKRSRQLVTPITLHKGPLDTRSVVGLPRPPLMNYVASRNNTEVYGKCVQIKNCIF